MMVTMPFTLPGWMPGWVPVLVLIPALIWGLAFLFMPFGVIGVKGRLEAIEARMDEIQAEIRSLSLRLPEPMRASSYDEMTSYVSPERTARVEPLVTRPPIPPAPQYPEADDDDDPRILRHPGGRPERARAARRAEPRLDWR